MPTKFGQAFHAELLRPDDLLHLQVDGVNLRLVSNKKRNQFLSVEDRAQPAFLRFTFAPQTIAESAFFEAALVPETNTPIKPENDPKRPDPDQNNKDNHPALPAPGTVSPESAKAAAEAAKPGNKTTTVAQMGHPSRLVFVVPADASIPFTFDGLLDWSKLELSVNGIAAIGDNAPVDQIANAPAIHEPTANETAIELPYQLVISPTREVAWLHRAQPFTSRGRTELWHTRLALKSGGEITELSKTNLASLRAIWSPDYDPNQLPAVQDDPELGRTAMCGNDRHQIVVLTSAFHGYEVKRTLVGRKHRPVNLYGPYVPQPFHADRLMLSSLGGWLRSHGQWEPPRRAQPIIHHRPDFGEIFKNIGILRDVQRLDLAGQAPIEHPIEIIDEPFLFSQPQPQQLDLSEWVHLATQGRDHYVKIVYEGELWPFRHPAALIKVTERKFEETNGIVGAYLMQRMFIVVRKPVMDFAPTDRGNPLKSVRLTTVVTPDIADPTLGITTNRTFWVEVMTSMTTRDYFHFHAVGTDVEGNTVDFTVPLVFVSISDIGYPANQRKVIAAYNDTATKIVERRACNIPGQKVAFAPKDPAKPTDTTQLVTDSLNFIMDAARVQPTLLKAAVKIPQVQELLGTTQPTSVRLFPDYVAKGADDPANTTGVFAQIVDDTYNEFNPANPTATLGVKIAAEKAGGMATPNMAVTTLSRALGPLAGKVEDAVKNNFDPTQFFPKGAAQLFGSFDLLELFLPKVGPPAPMSLDENAPKMQTVRKPAGGGGEVVVTTLDWKPKFLEPDGKFETPIASIYKNFGGTTSVLDITGTITKPINPGKLGAPPLGDATTDFAGKLNAFTVTILASVSINFANFSFRKKTNEKADVKVNLDPTTPLEFKGDLAFIEEIRNAIPPGLFSDGPSLDLIDNPLGIRAGFAFALPPLTVAVFTLKDVKLGAALTLPFLDGKPVFDFNISERPHPFLLAVGIFGGGGFFHLQLDTAGIKALEVSLEFGATAALDIGVASGEVHIMAGIYFSLQRKEGSTDLAAILSGYLRLGGSLNVLGLISISVEFNLSFTYDGVRDKAYGRATLTVSVHVLFFSTSVELTVERAFGGSGDPHFIDFFPDPEPWSEYALGFA